MKARTMKFRFHENEDYGLVGLLPIDAPGSFEPLSSGMGIVHDLVEHDLEAENRGSFEDECHAFGVMHWLRGQGHYWASVDPWTSRRGAPEMTHGELVDFMLKHFQESQDPLDLPVPRTTEDEGCATEMVDETIRLMREYFSPDMSWGCFDDDEDEDVTAWFEAQLPTVRLWLLDGWASADARFECCPTDAVAAFIALAAEVDKVMLDAEDLENQGAEVTLTWNDASLAFSLCVEVECGSCGSRIGPEDACDRCYGEPEV